MEIFLTGATGFIGGGIAAALRERGDGVRALVRDPAKAAGLQDIGCTLVPGDLADRAALAEAMRGADAVIHCAAVYEVGIKESDRPRVYAANVEGTENTLGAALDAAIPRVVYVSTVAVFGNTRGEVVSEGYRNTSPHTSYYEETKALAHDVAQRLIAEGLPCVIVQPGGVYGPDDHSALGDLLERYAKHRLPALTFPDLGLVMVHRDDVVAGVLLALDRGTPGESYVLGGEVTTMREVFETFGKVLGRKPPRLTFPTSVLKVLAPLGPVVGPPLGFPPNFRELISSSDGVTFWASDDKARRDLGYAPRSLEQGLRDTFAGART